MRPTHVEALLPAPIDHIPPAMIHRLDSLNWKDAVLAPLRERDLEYVWQLATLDLGTFLDLGLARGNSDVIHSFLTEHRLCIGMQFQPDEIQALQALTTHAQ